jgi:hypothetical protein
LQENFSEVVITELSVREVFDVKICRALLLKWSTSILLGNILGHKQCAHAVLLLFRVRRLITLNLLLLVDDFAIHLLDGLSGCLKSFKLDEAISTGLVVGINRDFAGLNLTKAFESLVKVVVTPSGRKSFHEQTKG